MKVLIKENELREALRQLHTRRNGEVLVSEMELRVSTEETPAHEPQPDAHPDALSPEEQIRRNPELALDAPEQPPLHDDAVTRLLRWCHHPEAAQGKTFYVPKDHPSGLGGLSIYVPKSPSYPPQVRRVSVRLTVPFAGKEWNVSHIPDVVVGDSLAVDVDRAGRVRAMRLFADAQGRYISHKLTEMRVD